MISHQLWQTNQDLSLACLEHPFVQGIAQGTLAPDRFAYYVGQDAFFLGSFAKAYSIAAAKAPDWEGFQAFHSLATGVLEELHFHQRYAEKWNVNLENITPGIATRRYTDFLLAIAWGNDIGLITAAMTPCLRLYAFLGQQLAQSPFPNHQYTDWIHTYNSPDFELLAQRLEGLSDRYIKDEKEAHSIYRYAMLCERDFFQAAWEGTVISNQ